MNILFVSSWFPYPPDNGSRIRAYNLLKTLSASHNVSMISLYQSDSKIERVDALNDICRVISLHEAKSFKPGTIKSIAGYFSVKPRSFIDTFDPTIKTAVMTGITQTKPDAIVVSELAAMIYMPERPVIPVILDALEMGLMCRYASDSHGLKSLARQLTLLKHRRFITDILKRTALYTCVSDDELRLCSSFFPCSAGSVIPNGVDTEHYTPNDRKPEFGILVYNGALTYSANLGAVRYFCESIQPLLLERIPEARMLVTGRTTGVDLTGIEGCPGIELTGYVDDIRTVLNRSSICIVPLRQGGGSRLKILEAMAAGIPVVSTSVGAEGLNCVPGKHLLIADEPDSFVSAIESILTDAELAERLSSEARLLVENQYSWKTIGQRLVGLVDGAVAHGSMS
jgi:glycosyltransferase involved in cell wall biosynthesis